MTTYGHLTIGTLALQGDFQRHQHQLDLLGIRRHDVRRVADLDDLDALIIPGGESTTMDKLLDRFRMRQNLIEFGQTRPIWGTCAGMIMLASRIEDNQSGVTPLGLMDIDVLRNGYGRQVYSFEEPIEADLGDGPTALKASFIRAPKVTRAGDSVKTLAVYQDSPVLLSENKVLASAFHTELDDDTLLLEFFVRNFLMPR